MRFQNCDTAMLPRGVRSSSSVSDVCRGMRVSLECRVDDWNEHGDLISINNNMISNIIEEKY
ncbi:hypothetical protein BMS3Abin07_02298 [bacterium BMS3Abin07]|nr:hypothetical protein BMS3Abin07_02298 [bacterium BMS3Abin07]